MRIEETKLKTFIEIIEENISPKVDMWVRDFEGEKGHKPDVIEVMRLDLDVMLPKQPSVSPPDEISDKLSKGPFVSSVNKVWDKLNESLSKEEITQSICSILEYKNRDELLAYVVPVAYELTRKLEPDVRVSQALSNAIEKFAEIDWPDLPRELLSRHTSKEEIDSFAIKLLKSENYKVRNIGENLIYTAGYLSPEFEGKLLDAYKIAYKHEQNEKTKSPYPERKKGYAKRIEEYSKKLEEMKKPK